MTGYNGYVSVRDANGKKINVYDVTYEDGSVYGDVSMRQVLINGLAHSGSSSSKSSNSAGGGSGSSSGSSSGLGFGGNYGGVPGMDIPDNPSVVFIEYTGSGNETFDGFVIAGGFEAVKQTAQLPPIGDELGIGLVLITMLMLSNSLSFTVVNVQDDLSSLKRQLTAKQREKFKEMHDKYKDKHNMQPNDNIPWPILVEMVREVKEQYRGWK